jgi:hypothetical protein
MQWNGVRVLVDHGFYSTGVLRMMEVFRSYPSLAGDIDHRLAFADALEKVELRGEALTEYGSLSQRADLTRPQRVLIESRLNALQK